MQPALFKHAEPSFKVYFSNKPEILLKKFLNLFAENKFKDNPFEKDYILVPNVNFKEWLTYKTTDKFNIAANITFFQPNDLIDELYKLLNQVRNKKIFDRQNLTWAILDILKSPIMEKE